MKNKSTLIFYTFIILCYFSLLVNAQNKKVNNDFTISIVKYSDKSNIEKEHVHVLELKNNSKSTSEFSLTSFNDNCSDNNLNNDKSSNIDTVLYLNGNKELNSNISLKSNESVEIHLKTQQKTNVQLGTRNCTTIQAINVSQNKSKTSQSVTIQTFIRNPINEGH